MSSVYTKVMDHVFRWEGGYVNHRDDPGGATNFGITHKTLAKWRGVRSVTPDEVKAMTRNEAEQIYAANYWAKIRGDELPGPIAFVMMDAAVNSGPGNAVKAIQKACNSLGQTLKVDGKIGPKTIAAINNCETSPLLNEFIVRRGVFYGSLVTFTTFGLGWARRLVEGARAANSILEQEKRANTPAPPSAPSVKPARDAMAEIPSGLDVRRHFFDERGVQVFGTFFSLWGGWATAGHVMNQMLRTNPPFAPGAAEIDPQQMDAALLGCLLPDAQPSAPVEGQKVSVFGFPAGSSTPSIRSGEVYLRRPSSDAWIATIETPSEPVVVGMSGGPVCDEASGEVIGILITRNSPADLDADGRMDQNFDFVSLHDLWAAARQTAAVA